MDTRPPAGWAIAPSLAGIHCAALNAEDFATPADHGGAMVSSPLSNLLLDHHDCDSHTARPARVPEQ
jgi:cytosine/adenosine deaminase-related metal-dependent hydrolase